MQLKVIPHIVKQICVWVGKIYICRFSSVIQLLSLLLTCQHQRHVSPASESPCLPAPKQAVLAVQEAEVRDGVRKE